jgi:hypothetical protein
VVVVEWIGGGRRDFCASCVFADLQTRGRNGASRSEFADEAGVLGSHGDVLLFVYGIHEDDTSDFLGINRRISADHRSAEGVANKDEGTALAEGSEAFVEFEVSWA